MAAGTHAFRVLPAASTAHRLKYLAGVELGAGTFVNDTKPEVTAAHLRRAVDAALAKPPVRA